MFGPRLMVAGAGFAHRTIRCKRGKAIAALLKVAARPASMVLFRLLAAVAAQ
jgi:hypothetical protein